MNTSFKGTGIAMVTPFSDNGDIDFNGLKKLTRHLIDGGVEYLVVMGTTGESATISPADKMEILKTVQTENAGKCPIVYGLGGNNTEAIAREMKSMDTTGIDAFLSVSPYYNKPTQEGIYQHYAHLSKASSLPIILYNVPGRTGSNIGADTTLRLARDFDNIIAIKEASGSMEQVMQIIHERPQGFLVISGDDNLTFPMIALGGDGVISVSGQAYPQIFSGMVRDALSGKIESARKAHYQLFRFTQLLFTEGNPGGIKTALKQLNVCDNHLRLPLWPISESTKNALLAEMKKIG
ncbi:MAG: 4-hydroxy-tetrahydrodipicolinate synthase [Cryomorphaceae bacterium]|nr:4-hydroxy-tetrahydrodipicolinate synthase [Cryomorphaceae bacterium]